MILIATRLARPCYAKSGIISLNEKYNIVIIIMPTVLTALLQSSSVYETS